MIKVEKTNGIQINTHPITIVINRWSSVFTLKAAIELRDKIDEYIKKLS